MRKLGQYLFAYSNYFFKKKCMAIFATTIAKFSFFNSLKIFSKFLFFIYELMVILLS
jgi:hypothetical protein